MLLFGHPLDVRFHAFNAYLALAVAWPSLNTAALEQVARDSLWVEDVVWALRVRKTRREFDKWEVSEHRDEVSSMSPAYVYTERSCSPTILPLAQVGPMDQSPVGECLVIVLCICGADSSYSVLGMRTTVHVLRRNDGSPSVVCLAFCNDAVLKP